MEVQKRTHISLNTKEVKKAIRLYLLQQSKVYPELGIDNVYEDDIKLTAWENESEPDGCIVLAEWSKKTDVNKYE